MNSNGDTDEAQSSGRDAAAVDADKQAERLEHEIEEIRDNLGGLVTELDHRRHRLNPLNALGAYPLHFAVGGALVLGAVLGGVVWHRARQRERDSFVGRTRRLQSAMRRAIDKPDKVAQTRPNVGMKILTAAGTAAAAVVARRLATRLLERRS